MNKNRWKNPDVSILALALKLNEEASEVGNVLTDFSAVDGWDVDNMPYPALQHMLVELGHVQHIAAVMTARATRAIDKYNTRV